MQGHMRARWWLRNVIPGHRPQTGALPPACPRLSPGPELVRPGAIPWLSPLMAVVSDKPLLPLPATGCLYNLTFGRL